VRNGFLLLLSLLLVLLVGGVVLASTGPGAALLSRIGVPGWRDPGTAAQVTATPTRGGSVSMQPRDESPTQAPRKNTVVPPTPTRPGAASTAETPAATNTTSKPSPTATKPPPAATVEPTASPLEVAQAYMANWKAGRYDGMYRLVSQDSLKQLGYDRQRFIERYQGIATEATITGWQPALRPEAAQAAKQQEPLLRLPYDVKITTQVVGDINETNLLPLVKENNSWRVQWSPSLIFKDLSGDLRIRKQLSPSTRGNIFDRSGEPLAIEGQIAQVGVVPGEIKNERQMLRRLSRVLGMSAEVIQGKYKGREPTYFWPVRDLTQQREEELRPQLEGIPGVAFGQRPGRVYPQGTVLAHVLGYVTGVYAEDLKNPQYATYSEGDVIGRAGLEAWGEQYLRGQPGGKIFILDPATGAEVKVIKERRAKPGNDIYLNIDLTLQKQAEQDLGGRPGAIVALDPRDGRILALVSQPSFDPNKFVTGFPQDEYERLTRPEANNPFQFRAVASTYPMASTFKPITASAAITYKLPRLGRTWYSTGTWDRLGPDQVRRDWKAGGHGYVKFLDSITESIDTIYYDLGYELYQKCRDCLSEHAKQWGLGSKLGVDGFAIEAHGLVPGPGNPFPGWSAGDNVNLAIGQGALQVSPLQVAFVYSTIANGGTMYRPLLINRIVAPDENGRIVKVWKPTVMGRAPASRRTIRFLQLGLRSVVESPKGTAYGIFKDAPFSSAGKTGTGQQDKADPYAWYAGYAPAISPRITVVAFGDRQGEGYQVAAPVVRKVMEQYLQPPVARP
jgi:penicillin-binding protein 2